MSPGLKDGPLFERVQVCEVCGDVCVSGRRGVSTFWKFLARSFPFQPPNNGLGHSHEVAVLRG